MMIRDLGTESYPAAYCTVLLPLYFHSLYPIMCIPIICGLPTKVKQDGDAGRMCPMCNNPSVMKAQSRTWFELFWIPLVPFKSKHIWICGICHWEMKVGDGNDPQPPQGWNQRPPQGAMHAGQGGYH